MKFFKYAIVTLLILYLVTPADSGWFRRTIKKIKKVVKKIRKPLCKGLFGFICPRAAEFAGAALATSTSGLGTLAVGAGVKLAKYGCRVGRRNCKRSVRYEEIFLPFSDEFYDYDKNYDKEITYDEFQFSILTSIGMADPEELIEPFVFADADGNGKIDMDEFQGAPFMFAHVYHSISAAA